MSHARQLNYAPHTPAHKRLSRSMVITAILLACVSSSLWWAPAQWRRIQLLYWQRRCLAYTTAANQPILHPASTGSWQCPREWTMFYSIYSPPGFRSAGTLFLHELKRPDGQSRLVALDLGNRDPVAAIVFPRVFVPGTLLQLPYETRSSSRSIEIPVPSPTIFPALPDPSDQTHFTFKAQVKSTVVIFDGWLGNDDRIVIGQRNKGPAAK